MSKLNLSSVRSQALEVGPLKEPSDTKLEPSVSTPSFIHFVALVLQYSYT